MLYKLIFNEQFDTIDGIEPIPFEDFQSLGKLEKDLEDLIAKNIFDVLFEDARLMPVHQERRFQKEADIYALDERGALFIFELKRSTAGDDAVVQAMRYAQDAGQWTYRDLLKKFRKYQDNDKADLLIAHKEGFNLENSLDVNELNNKQHLIIIGNVADDNLINAVDYWQRQGVSIKFFPYRVYDIEGNHYFEFFSLPFDRHRNPQDIKGVLFDTNRTYDEDAIWYMMENNRVAAFGEAMRFISYLQPKDIVFFSHRGEGIVAAAKVEQGLVCVDGPMTCYRNVTFKTPIPNRNDDLIAMPFSMVSEITGKRFFWARTIKVPYLSKSEAENLVQELGDYLNGNNI